VPTFVGRPNTPGFLPELVDVVRAGSSEQGGGRYTHLLVRHGCRLADEMKGAWGKLRVHEQAPVPGSAAAGVLGV
jgi:hypothetical protein